MKKALITVLLIFAVTAGFTQITVKVGSALLQTPGSDVHLPVSVTGLDATTGGIPVVGIELHIKYNNVSLIYDTTLNFSGLVPASQWYYGVSTEEYAANWVEPSLLKLNIPDNTVLFDVVFSYQGGNTELVFDSLICLLLDSAFNIIPDVHYINGLITPSQGSDESRWNGVGPWNTAANWTNGIPGDNTNAVIETGQVTLLSNGSCKSLTVNAGTVMNLSPAYSLTVNGDYSNNGTFNLLSDATGTGSVIVSGLVSGSGINTFKRYLDFSSGFPHFVASPVTSSTAAVFGGSMVEKYAEPSAAWQQVPQTGTLANGTGYRVTGTATTAVNFQGAFQTSDVQVTGLDYTASTAVEARGFNLLGNPYPSAIQWEQGNWIRTHLDYAVYVWNGYKFLTWNGMTGSLKSGIIPAMQGFMVKSNAAGAAITVPSGARLHSDQPYYKEAEVLSNVLTMKLESVSGDGFFDEAYVSIQNGSTSGFDGAHDAWKLFGNPNYPQIYTTGADQSKLSINTKPDFGSLPVDFQVGSAGSYRISFSNFESFDPGQPLFFEDKENNTVINIRNSGEFVFNTEVTTNPDRLVLHFAEVGMREISEGNFSAWCSGSTCRIISGAGRVAIEQVDVFNSLGQTVYHGTRCETPVEFDLKGNSHGLHILRIKTAEGIFTKKLILLR